MCGVNCLIHTHLNSNSNNRVSHFNLSPIVSALFRRHLLFLICTEYVFIHFCNVNVVLSHRFLERRLHCSKIPPLTLIHTLTHFWYSLNAGAHIESFVLPLRKCSENQVLKQASYCIFRSLQQSAILFILRQFVQ